MANGRAISAVVPAWNEEQGLVETVESLRAALAGCAEEFEIVLVDDGSTDATGRLMDGLAEKYPQVRVIHHRQCEGYGASLRDGFLAAKLRLVLQTDASGRFDFNEIPLLVARIDQADIVAGYRARRSDSWGRRLLSWGFRFLAGLTFGVYLRDVNCPLKLYRRKVFKQMTMVSRGRFIDAEILAKANVLGYRIDEVAVTHRPPKAGRRGVPLGMGTVLREAWKLLHTFDLKPDPTVRREVLGTAVGGGMDGHGRTQ